MSDYPSEDPFADASEDADHMRLALDRARSCLDAGDVPVGCVIVRRSDGEVVAAAGNARERLRDPTAHAEILALREASGAEGSWHLDGHTMVVTLEPCAMCAGAAVLSRIDRIVFGAADLKAGFAGSLGNLVQDARLNHRVELASGILADECGELLRAFFRDRR
jgi:tRNA(adenine34) deaminase